LPQPESSGAVAVLLRRHIGELFDEISDLYAKLRFDVLERARCVFDHIVELCSSKHLLIIRDAAHNFRNGGGVRDVGQTAVRAHLIDAYVPGGRELLRTRF
jgi:hypothetical protein